MSLNNLVQSFLSRATMCFQAAATSQETMIVCMFELSIPGLLQAEAILSSEDLYKVNGK